VTSLAAWTVSRSVKDLAFGPTMYRDAHAREAGPPDGKRGRETRPQKPRQETRALEVCSVRALTESRQLSAEPCLPDVLRSPEPARKASENEKVPEHTSRSEITRLCARLTLAVTLPISDGFLSGPTWHCTQQRRRRSSRLRRRNAERATRQRSSEKGAAAQPASTEAKAATQTHGCMG
jgi:hypothetical protein